MKLDYFTLLSPEPVFFQNVGGVRCPTLREIATITYSTYQLYLSVFLMTPFDEITENPQTRLLAENALSFFLNSNYTYNEGYHAFLSFDSEKNATDTAKPIGVIHKEIWRPLCEIILQRNCVKVSDETSTDVKSERAKKIMQKLQKGRQTKLKRSKSDPNMELGNIISAVANKSNTLNMKNIWDITVYQLWDSFYRLCHNNILDIQSMSVAAWGDKEHRFDANAWFQNLSSDN